MVAASANDPKQTERATRGFGRRSVAALVPTGWLEACPALHGDGPSHSASGCSGADYNGGDPESETDHHPEHVEFHKLKHLHYLSNP
jgi:hypothetical protein